jgi:DNA-binding MarR family transcriptional regulator
MSPFGTIPISRRIRDGIDRIGAVLRADQWSAAQTVGLSPTQNSILAFLAGRGDAGMRVKEIATHLGVSQPSATDSIAALERKQFVQKISDQNDARAIGVSITLAGRAILKAAGMVTAATDNALAALTISEQTDLLLLLTKIMRHLQIAGSVPVQRMCVSCAYFRPNIHSGADHPHHCAFVNAAFGDRDLRIDCGDHKTADPATQATTWMAFENGSANLQAP